MTPYDRSIDWLSTFVVVGRIEIVAGLILCILVGIFIGAVVGRQMLKRRLRRDSQTYVELARANRARVASEHEGPFYGDAPPDLVFPAK